MYTASTILAFFGVLSSIFPTLASPVASSSAIQSSLGALPTLDVAAPRHPKKPICSKEMGRRPPRTIWFEKNCEEAIKMIPRDTRPYSPLRNFYLSERDKSTTMPNVALPFEREYGMEKPLESYPYCRFWFASWQTDTACTSSFLRIHR